MKGLRLAIVRSRRGLGVARENVSGWAVGLISLNLSMRKGSELGWHPGRSRQWGGGLGALTRSAAGDQTNPPCSAHGFNSRGRPIDLDEPSLRILHTYNHLAASCRASTTLAVAQIAWQSVSISSCRGPVVR